MRWKNKEEFIIWVNAHNSHGGFGDIAIPNDFGEVVSPNIFEEHLSDRSLRLFNDLHYMDENIDIYFMQQFLLYEDELKLTYAKDMPNKVPDFKKKTATIKKNVQEIHDMRDDHNQVSTIKLPARELDVILAMYNHFEEKGLDKALIIECCKYFDSGITKKPRELDTYKERVQELKNGKSIKEIKTYTPQ